MRASLSCYKIPDTYSTTVTTVRGRPFISLSLFLSLSSICPPLSVDPKCPADVDFNSTDMDIKTITSALKFYLRWVKHAWFYDVQKKNYFFKCVLYICMLLKESEWTADDLQPAWRSDLSSKYGSEHTQSHTLMFYGCIFHLLCQFSSNQVYVALKEKKGLSTPSLLFQYCFLFMLY